MNGSSRLLTRMPKVSKELNASQTVPRMLAIRRPRLAWCAAALLSVSLAACGPSDANTESASNGTAANSNAGSPAVQAAQSAANAQLQAAAPSADGLASPVMHYAQ